MEEVTQLKAADVSVEGLNGGSVLAFHFHEEDENNHLKTDTSTRTVPVHSALVRMGFEEYLKALPKGSMLFPGLTRRASRDNKIGAYSGELYRRLLKSLGLKRKGKCFHSWRHTANTLMRQAGVPLGERAAIIGHQTGHISDDVYAKDGPGIALLKAAVEKIAYALDGAAKALYGGVKI
jgi:integrase